MVPPDLEAAFSKNKSTEAFYLSLSKSSRKTLLYRIVQTKRPETKQKRIDEIVTQMANHQKPS